MMTVLDGTVMNALMSAASYAKMNQLCTGIAAGSGDEEAAQRAMGYANLYRDKAMTAAEQVEEAVLEQAQRVREEERLAAAGTGNRAAADAVPQTSRDTVVRAPQPAATLELSQAYQDRAQAGAAAETGGAQPAAPPAKPGTAAKAPAPEIAVHTADTPQILFPVKAAAVGRRGFSMDLRV